MKKYLAILLIAITGVIIGFYCNKPLQIEYRESGNIKDDSAVIAKVPILRFEEMGRGTSAPIRYIITTPPTEQQGPWGACGPFGSAYAARSIEWYYATNATSYSKLVNVFSPEYVYTQTKFNTDCSSGTTIIRCLDLMLAQGICLWNTMPYDWASGDCVTLPNAAQKAEAANYKIAAYSKLDPRDFTTIKGLLSANHPIVSSISAEQGFRDLKDSSVYIGGVGSPTIHIVCIVGYDENKHAYKIMNSWGAGWGDNGFAWVGMDWLSTISGWQFAMVSGTTNCPASGTLIRYECKGFDKYVVYANGTCGEMTPILIQVNSPYCNYVPPPADTTKPVVTIIKPIDGATIRGNSFNINASATDNIGVVSMAATFDGKPVCTTTGNYLGCSWNRLVQDRSGTHTITVTAKDGAGNTGTKSITIIN